MLPLDNKYYIVIDNNDEKYSSRELIRSIYRHNYQDAVIDHSIRVMARPSGKYYYTTKFMNNQKFTTNNPDNDQNIPEQYPQLRQPAWNLRNNIDSGENK